MYSTQSELHVTVSNGRQMNGTHLFLHVVAKEFRENLSNHTIFLLSHSDPNTPTMTPPSLPSTRVVFLPHLMMMIQSDILSPSSFLSCLVSQPVHELQTKHLQFRLINKFETCGDILLPNGCVSRNREHWRGLFPVNEAFAQTSIVHEKLLQPQVVLAVWITYHGIVHNLGSMKCSATFFFNESKGKPINVANRAETHVNRWSLTTSASEGMLSPHPGACQPNRDWAKASTSCSIVGNHAAASEEFWD